VYGGVKMAVGWIRLHRRMLEWEWFDDHNTFRLFLYVLLKANYEPKSWHGIVIERGQLLTSLPTLTKATGISVQSIRTSISKLKSTGELTDKSTSKNRLLTIVKYDEYQSENGELTGKSTDKLTGKQQTTNRQLTATKERKNIKEEKKKEIYTPEFTSFWDDYGKIGNKQQAFKAYNKHTKGVNYETIINGLGRYQAQCRANNTEQKYIQHASTWLNQWGWEQEYPIYKSESKTDSLKEALSGYAQLEESVDPWAVCEN